MLIRAILAITIPPLCRKGALRRPDSKENQVDRTERGGTWKLRITKKSRP